MATPPKRLTGNERLTSTESGVPAATVLDFWRWAMSDLRANDNRGVFAEWLVAQLLGLDLSVRESWAGCDLVTPKGVKIEVKAGAYLQAWDQKAPSKIVFSGLKAHLWTPEAGYAATETYNAELYVFCVQTEKDSARWNALNLDQWRFYVLRREDLEQLGSRSVTLGTVARLAQPLTAAEFAKHVRGLI